MIILILCFCYGVLFCQETGTKENYSTVRLQEIVNYLPHQNTFLNLTFGDSVDIINHNLSELIAKGELYMHNDIPKFILSANNGDIIFNIYFGYFSGQFYQAILSGTPDYENISLEINQTFLAEILEVLYKYYGKTDYLGKYTDAIPVYYWKRDGVEIKTFANPVRINLIYTNLKLKEAMDQSLDDILETN